MPLKLTTEKPVTRFTDMVHGDVAILRDSAAAYYNNQLVIRMGNQIVNVTACVKWDLPTTSNYLVEKVPVNTKLTIEVISEV